MRKINENTTTSRSAGEYNVPLSLGLRSFEKKQLQPFTVKTSHYDSALLDYDSRDGSIDIDDHLAKKLEKRAEELTTWNKKHPTQSDEDGNNLNNGLESDHMIKPINEDLGVWFGTKKKPKGSKQPKGPWVNICRKKDGGGHPPCGRPEASSKGYPKCRAAGVAAKMSDSQKKSACQQKRKAEKYNPKSGTGNKPKMVSYKPKNESLRQIIKRVLREGYNSEKLYSMDRIYMNTQFAPIEIKKIVRNLTPIPCVNKYGEKKMCAKITKDLYDYIIGKS
jgi:hypothetical protein